MGITKHKKFQSCLLQWSTSNLRKFPWRKKRISPYNILVAEMLLKRTTAKAAASVYTKILKKYSNVEKLASANEKVLAGMIRPIGYPKRSKEMIAAAKFIVTRFHSSIPNEKGNLMSIPFVGDYISGAVLSLAFDKPFPMVDSNVNRIISRVYYGINPRPYVTQLIKDTAMEILPKDGHRGFNLAMLDVGGTICHPQVPKCTSCPLMALCRFQNKHLYM